MMNKFKENKIDFTKTDIDFQLMSTLEELNNNNFLLYFGNYTKSIGQIWHKKQNYIFEYTYNKKLNQNFVSFKTEYTWYFKNDYEKFKSIFGESIDGIKSIGSGMKEIRFLINKKEKLSTLVKKIEKIESVI